MSPLTLSSPAAQVLHPARSNRGVRFGHDENPQPKSTDAATSTDATSEVPQDSVEIGKESEGKPAEQSAVKPAPKNLSFLDRLTQFFEYIGKAFKVLFGEKKEGEIESPKSKLDLQLKSMKHNLRSALAEGALPNSPKEKESLQKDLDNLDAKAEAVLDTENHVQLLQNWAKTLKEVAPEESKKEHAEFLMAMKTPEGSHQFIKDYLGKPDSKLVAHFNKENDTNWVDEKVHLHLLQHPEDAPAWYKGAGVTPSSKTKPTLGQRVSAMWTWATNKSDKVENA